MAGKLELKVNGAAYGGWKRIAVTRSMESISGGFDLEVSDRWDGQKKPWPIAERDACEVVLDGQTAITGYVDRRNLSYDANSHTLRVAGRDATANLVDSSAVLSQWEFKNITVPTFAAKIATPFGIPVIYNFDASKLPPLTKLTIHPGDSCFEAIERACRMRGLTLFSDGLGNLIMAKPAGGNSATTALVEGENILAASADYDASGRFYRYVAVGQHPGDKNLSGESTVSIFGEAFDENETRTARVFMTHCEGKATPAYAKQRAQWEAKVRSQRGDVVSVTVQGWTMASGLLWPLNGLVKIRAPFLGVDGEMLITQAVHTLDEGGTLSQLTLRRPDSFAPEPVITKASTAQWAEIKNGV